MQITLTNATTAPVYVATACQSLAAGATCTITRNLPDFLREIALLTLLNAGTLTATYVKETTDSIPAAFGPLLPHYTTGALPVSTAVPPYTMVYNTTSNSVEVSIGGSWKAVALT